MPSCDLLPGDREKIDAAVEAGMITVIPAGTTTELQEFLSEKKKKEIYNRKHKKANTRNRFTRSRQ